VEIRPASDSDLPSLNEVYNHYVATTHVTFDIEPVTPDERRAWFRHYAATGRHRLFVAVEDGSVVGFASSSRFRAKAAYDTSVETTVYVAPGVVGRGVGAMLYDELFAALSSEDLHRAYAGIALPNPGSIRLHERFGFSRIAVYAEVGRKFGRYWDVAWYEKELG
jgi:phosphinothricin acetyltransferase